MAMTMPKQHGNVDSEIKPTERRSEKEEYNPVSTTNNIRKVQKEEYLIKNACNSVIKYYLCKQNNKRSLLGRKQRSQAARSFPNRYLFSYTNKVTSLFSNRYILIIILHDKGDSPIACAMGLSDAIIPDGRRKECGRKQAIRPDTGRMAQQFSNYFTSTTRYLLVLQNSWGFVICNTYCLLLSVTS